MRRFGVIDLGSNTFHLLVAEWDSGKGLRPIYKKRIFTSLSDGGIDFIKSDRISAGIAALQEFRYDMNRYECESFRAVGTAVLRTASNRQEFLSKAEEVLLQQVEIINGSQEADYIFKGITLSPEINTGTHMVMDIGGGSTECIIIRDGHRLFSKSYVVGVGSLYSLFHHTEPISHSDMDDMTAYILNIIDDLRPVIERYRPEYLTGASGSFEVLAMMSDNDTSEIRVSECDLPTFYNIYDQIVSSDEVKRAQMKGLPKERVKLIVVGMIWKKIMVDLVKPSKILIAPFALKEGVLIEMIND